MQLSFFHGVVFLVAVRYRTQTHLNARLWGKSCSPGRTPVTPCKIPNSPGLYPHLSGFATRNTAKTSGKPDLMTM